MHYIKRDPDVSTTNKYHNFSEWYFIQPIQFSYNKRYFKNMAGIINLIWSFEDKLFPGR